VDRAAPGFFVRRKSPDFGIRAPLKSPYGLAEYENVPTLIGALVSAKLATLHELQTVYGLEDAYNLLEILLVDRHNERVLNDRDKE
jgi:hypothetical protein